MSKWLFKGWANADHGEYGCPLVVVECVDCGHRKRVEPHGRVFLCAGCRKPRPKPAPSTELVMRTRQTLDRKHGMVRAMVKDMDPERDEKLVES